MGFNSSMPQWEVLKIKYTRNTMGCETLPWMIEGMPIRLMPMCTISTNQNFVYFVGVGFLLWCFAMHVVPYIAEERVVVTGIWKERHAPQAHFGCLGASMWLCVWVWVGR